jgi:hypothetical protein
MLRHSSAHDLDLGEELAESRAGAGLLMDFMEGKGDQREGNLANGSTEEEGGIVLH